MGCDIHVYVEHKLPSDERWHSFGRKLLLPRSYRTFERLAGVRGDAANAICAPRGFPADAGYEANDDYWLYISEDPERVPGDGSCTRKQAREWHARGAPYKADREGFICWVAHPDWHTHSWLTGAEFAEATKDASLNYAAVVAILQFFEKEGHQTRVVFWFDN